MYTKVDVKAEVLSVRSQVRYEFQGSIVKFVVGSFEVNIFSKDMMEMNIENN